jgi:proline dehydrogenase
LVRQLRAESKGALFAYSVEVDTSEATGGARSTGEPVHKLVVQEMIRSIDVAGDFEDSQARADGVPGSGRRTWVAIKLVSFISIQGDVVPNYDAIGSGTQTALLPNPAALLNLSTHLSSLHKSDPILFPGCPRADDVAVLKLNEPPPGSPLSAQDLVDLRDLHEDLIRICTRARARDIRLIVDAEYSWYQVRSSPAARLSSGLTTYAACCRHHLPLPNARVQQRLFPTLALASAPVCSLSAIRPTTTRLCDIPSVPPSVSPRPQLASLGI